MKSGLAHNFIHVCVYTCVHVCLTNKKVLPHQEVFGACKSTRVARSHANRPQIACSLWMVHQLADFGFFYHHIANSHPCSLQSFWVWCHLQACFTCCKKKVSWAGKLGDQSSWQEKCVPNDTTLVTVSKQMPAVALAQTTQETLPEPHDGELERRPSWTLTVGSLFSIVGNRTHPNLSEIYQMMLSTYPQLMGLRQ